MEESNAPAEWNAIVNTVPANYLLDREGKIIAKDLRGEALLKKLTEIFGQ